jgi:hypothetical protein
MFRPFQTKAASLRLTRRASCTFTFMKKLMDKLERIAKERFFAIAGNGFKR